MNKKTAWRISISTLALSALLMTVVCNKNTEQSSNTTAEKQAAPAPGATGIDPATVATVSGQARMGGIAPKPAKIDMSQDPACKGSNESENVVASNGELANVFVYIK